MNPLIFLDIDGVLNCFHTWGRYRRLGHIDPECLRQLNRIIERTGARIVLSSSWRSFSKLRDGRLLRRFGVRGIYIGSTPRLGMPRGGEIATWLRKHRNATFVILDDDRDMTHLTQRLVHTRFKRGLTRADAERAISMLKAR